MSRLGTTAVVSGERSDALDHCLSGISRLSSEVKDASNYIPTYDQRIYAEVRFMKPHHSRTVCRFEGHARRKSDFLFPPLVFVLFLQFVGNQGSPGQTSGDQR